MASVLLVLSNLFFILPSVKSYLLHRYTRAILYFLMMLASAAYHTCNSWTGACLFSATFHRKLDFFFAQLLIPTTAFYLVKFRAWQYLERWLLIICAVVLVIVEANSDEPFIIQGLVGAFAGAVVIVYWIVYATNASSKGEARRFPRYHWPALEVGLWCTGVAVALFATQKSWYMGYPWIHSLWHTLAALGQYFILCSRDSAPKDATLDSAIPTAGESRKGSKRARY